MVHIKVHMAIARDSSRRVSKKGLENHEDITKCLQSASHPSSLEALSSAEPSEGSGDSGSESEGCGDLLPFVCCCFRGVPFRAVR